MSEAPEIDPSMRAVINTNFDTSNIVSMEKSLPQIQNTLRRCQSILKDHCGPQSGYAMLVNNMSGGINFEPNVFTRDGIKILSSIEFLSPLERYVKDLLTYVGTRVDNNAKDGTTTSMLFSSLFLDKVLGSTKKLQDLNLSFFQMNRCIERTFNTILQDIEKYTYSIEKIVGKPENEITENDKVRTAGLIAFMQALSSSGGNVELAIAMKEIFEKSPSVSWEFITSHNSIKETGKSFEVETAPYDTHFKCITSQANVLNAALSTEYEDENVTCLIISSVLSAGSFKTTQVLEWIKNFDTNKPLAIFAQFIDASFQSELAKINQLRNKFISLWCYSAETRVASMNYPYELMIAAAIAGAEPFDMDNNSDVITDKHIFVAKKLHWHDSFMDFYGIVHTVDDSNLHPFYADPSTATQFYKDTREAIEKQLSLYKNGHKPDGRMYGLFMEMLNKLACIHRPTLRLGGPVHEQLANNDVVQDVQGAIMSSLKHGFLINGPLAMYHAFCSTYTKFQKLAREATGITRNMYIFSTIILSDMCDSVSEILKTVYSLPDISYEKIIPDELCKKMMDNSDIYRNVLDIKSRSFIDFITMLKSIKKISNDSEEGLELGVTYPVLQPLAITTELLKRVQELLMKFINTNKIVVYGGVVVNKENTDVNSKDK